MIMSRRSSTREASRRRLVLWSLAPALALVAAVSMAVSIAHARPAPTPAPVAAGAGPLIPVLWDAPALHAPIRLQVALQAALEAAGADAPPIDWRVLAGLDYLTGKTTDTLQKLDGKEVRVPGFVVPLDDFMEDGAEFLLVPYYGACVHTPPPPPNQIIFVQMAGKKSVKLTLFDAVWMHGKLKIATVESPYGTVGFTLEGVKMEPYSSR